MSETKYEIHQSDMSESWHATKNGMPCATFLLESDARSFVAGEKAIEALKKLRDSLCEMLMTFRNYHDGANDPRFAVLNKVRDLLAEIQPIDSALSALPAEETK